MGKMFKLRTGLNICLNLARLRMLGNPSFGAGIGVQAAGCETHTEKILENTRAPTAPDETLPADLQEAEQLGRKIRVQRKAQGLSIRELAARSGLSIGMISQIEQGKSTPSLRSLRLISDTLRSPVSALFDQRPTGIPDDRYIVRKGKRQVLKLNGSVRKELLSPASLQHLEVFNVELQPGAESSAEAYTHSGEKAGILLEGVLHLWLDGDRFELHPGDTCQFSGAIPHRYANEGSDVCRVIWVLTPPSS
jgi:transcriptional regulator with XRE-family HTH domain